MAGGWDLCVEIICIAFDENHKELMNCSREQRGIEKGREGTLQRSTWLWIE